MAKKYKHVFSSDIGLSEIIEKIKRKLMKEFVDSIQRYLDNNIPVVNLLDDEIQYWVKEKEKWEGRAK